MRALLDQTIKSIEDMDDFGDMYILAKSSVLALAQLVFTNKISGHSKYVRLVIDFIENNYMKKITLKNLAEIAGISEFYLSSLIKKETGASIVDLINDIRIKESKRLLYENNLNIDGVAKKIGYANTSYFAKVFKERTGMTATAFSKNIIEKENIDFNSKNLLNNLLDQIMTIKKTIPNLFDVLRIIDPNDNNIWILNPDNIILENTCCACWKNNKYCENCVSFTTLKNNKPFSKIEKTSSNFFLIVSAPITFYKKKFVAELLKKIDKNFV